MKFSIVVVCLNPGKLLIDTIESVRTQSFENFEIIIKDGGSKDETKSLFEEYLNTQAPDFRERISFIENKDNSIYDAMNQAIEYCSGDYILFLNCGDKLYGNDTLKDICDKAKELEPKKKIIYGDTYFRRSNSIIKASPVINDSVCYRMIPCHQSILYSKDVFSESAFNIKYRIRADYEHFLRSYYKDKTEFVYLDMVVADYEGGGFSENKANKKTDNEEYREIVKKYIPFGARFKNRAFLIFTLHKLRAALANSPRFSRTYQKLKGKFAR